MSKIFDALKQAELAGVDRKNSPTSGGYNSLQLERRRTCRVRIDAPLFVYGYAGDNPFHEDACTVEIYAHGGLISMHSAVRPGEKLLVMNKGNESTQQCVVLSVRVQRERAFHVGFAFPVPMPQFWQNLEMGRSPLGHYLGTLGAATSSEAVQTQSVAKAAAGAPAETSTPN